MILHCISHVYFMIMVILQHNNVEAVNKDFWYYLVYVLSGLVVLFVLILTIKYLLNPGEGSEDHIKRIVLNDQKKNYGRH